MLEELLLTILGLEFDEDPDLGPRTIESLLLDGLGDPSVKVLNIRRGSIAIQRCNEDGPRVDLLWLRVEGLFGEGYLHSLGQLLDPAHVRFLTDFRSSELGEGHLEKAKGAQGARAAQLRNCLSIDDP